MECKIVVLKPRQVTTIAKALDNPDPGTCYLVLYSDARKRGWLHEFSMLLWVKGPDEAVIISKHPDWIIDSMHAAGIFLDYSVWKGHPGEILTAQNNQSSALPHLKLHWFAHISKSSEYLKDLQSALDHGGIPDTVCKQILSTLGKSKRSRRKRYNPLHDPRQGRFFTESEDGN